LPNLLAVFLNSQEYKVIYKIVAILSVVVPEELLGHWHKLPGISVHYPQKNKACYTLRIPSSQSTLSQRRPPGRTINQASMSMTILLGSSQKIIVGFRQGMLGITAQPPRWLQSTLSV
jgi:hypothetical protein